MTVRRLGIFLLAALSVVGCGADRAPDAEPWHAVVLTWQGDTSSTMTVNLVVESDAAVARARLDWWRSQPADENGPDENGIIEADVSSLFGVDGVSVYHFEITGLEAGERYDFSLAVGDRALGESRRFRTMPDQGPVRLAAGGDLGVEPTSLALMRQAAKLSPMALIIGGDLAYANGLPRHWPRWRTWLDYVAGDLVTPDGLSVPLIVAIGNHEVNVGRSGGVAETAPAEQKAPFYFGLLAQNQVGREADSGGPTYFRRRLGEAGALYVLDSDHLATYESQVDWLTARLIEDAGLTNRLALYHVPLYPAHREYEGSAEGRDAWESVFSRHRLTAAFENHDHVFKRSHRLSFGEISASGEGVLYLGDGCMGRDARTVDLQQRWYLARSASLPHFWTADLSLEGATFRAFDVNGDLIDSVATERLEVSHAEAVAAADRQLPRVIDLPPGTLMVEPVRTLLEDEPSEARVSGVLRNTTSFALLAELELADAEVQRRDGPASTPERARLGAGAQSVTLAAGEEASLEAVLTEEAIAIGAGKVLSFRLKYATVAGEAVSVGSVLLAPVRRHTISRLTQTPAIDGKLDDWTSSSAEAIRLGQSPVVDGDGEAERWSGPSDSSATIFLGWDDRGLLIAADVTDDDVVEGESDPEDTEGVLLFVDARPAEVRGIDDPLVAAGPGGVEVEDELLASGASPEDIVVERRPTAHGYTIEVLVPWRSMSTAGRPEELALNFGIVDTDGEHEAHELTWSTPWGSADRPHGLGTFELRWR